MVKVKICGITNLNDAREAVESGADALGFNFVRPPREISREAAKKIISRLAPEICKVGVFANKDEKGVRKAIDDCGLTAVQFHGDETPEYCAKFSGQVKVIKAFRIRDEEDLKDIGSYNVDFYLLDARTEKKGEESLWGGSGETFDWELAVKAKRFGRPVILAGGLNPDNVREAIEAAGPFAVDVSSGVEKTPGRKDFQLMKKFIRRAKIE